MHVSSATRHSRVPARYLATRESIHALLPRRRKRGTRGTGSQGSTGSSTKKAKVGTGAPAKPDVLSTPDQLSTLSESQVQEYIDLEIQRRMHQLSQPPPFLAAAPTRPSSGTPSASENMWSPDQAIRLVNAVTKMGQQPASTSQAYSIEQLKRETLFAPDHGRPWTVRGLTVDHPRIIHGLPTV